MKPNNKNNKQTKAKKTKINPKTKDSFKKKK